MCSETKTFWVGAITMLLGLLSFLNELPFMAAVPWLSSAILFVAGILMIILRFLTNKAVTPIFRLRRTNKP
jgi:putative Mn2+ efflux pump MntP